MDKDDIKEKYEKLFVTDDGDHCFVSNKPGLYTIIDFIESLITEARQTERESIKDAFCKRFIETIKTDDIQLIDLNNMKYVDASVEDIEKFFSSLGEQ